MRPPKAKTLIDLSRASITKFGPTMQANKALEEAQEFIDALAGFRGGTVSIEDLAREVCDVRITNAHMFHIISDVIGRERMMAIFDEKMAKFRKVVEGKEEVGK